MITSITLENFKCFRDEYIELASLTLLSGLNGMGKSTLIQSILLLRQSYNERVLEKGVSLNGSLLSIGTGKDLLYERAEKPEKIKISIEIDKVNENYWEIDYDAKSNFLPIYNKQYEVSLDQLSIFNNKFEYLSAERLGPRSIFPKSNLKVVEQKQLGMQGEYTQHYLQVYGKDTIENLEVRNESTNELYLLNQVQAWMDVISPGVRFQIQDYSQADLIGLQYRFVDNEVSNEYRPTNVGFGITYVLPVVVALLKAGKGDLVIIENPEAHLHPKGQRKIGELIARASQGGVQIIIETHSDHVLNGIRLSVKNRKIDRDKVKLHFFEKINIKGESNHTIISPNINDYGRLDIWPNNFFDEWDKVLNEFLKE